MAKTFKKNKTGAKAVSYICRNNGECSYCNSNRLYKTLKKLNIKI